jgi:hypothetical protein
MLDAASLITLALSLTIALDQQRILPTALSLIIRMFVPPLLLAVADNLAVLRVVPKLLPVIVGPAPALTLRLAADELLRTVNRKQKGTLAVGTAAALVHIDSSEIQPNL